MFPINKNMLIREPPKEKWIIEGEGQERIKHAQIQVNYSEISILISFIKAQRMHVVFQKS